MIDLSDCYNLGIITKSHGIRGQVVLCLNNLGFDDILEMGTAFLEIDGLPVPFFVYEYVEKDYNSVILSIEDIDSEQKARKLINCKLFARLNTLKINSKINSQYENLVGYEVFDKTHGRLGFLKDIQDFQQNRLFRIVDGKKEYLIPVQPEFIIKIDKTRKMLMISAPAGLIDLF